MISCRVKWTVWPYLDWGGSGMEKRGVVVRIPKMTGLQFLVLGLLLEGVKSGGEMRGGNYHEPVMRYAEA